MLGSSGAPGNWRSKVTAGIRQQPCSVAVVLGEVVTESSQHVRVEVFYGADPKCFVEAVTYVSSVLS